MSTKRKNRLIAGILAGGQSRRYGRDKAFVLWNGKSLINWVIKNTEEFTDNIYVLAKQKEHFQKFGYPVLVDDSDESTPINGILKISPLVKDWLLLLACDIPFFKTQVLNLLWDRKEEDKVCLYRIDGKLYPFLALYPKELLKDWENAYNKGKRRLRYILKDMPKIILEEEEIKDIDPALSSFTNINNPEQLKKLIL